MTEYDLDAVGDGSKQPLSSEAKPYDLDLIERAAQAAVLKRDQDNFCPPVLLKPSQALALVRDLRAARELAGKLSEYAGHPSECRIHYRNESMTGEWLPCNCGLAELERVAGSEVVTITDIDTHWTDELIGLNACSEAIAWGRAYPTAQAAWDACERGDWMLWCAGKRSYSSMSAGRRRLVGATAECARLVLPLFERSRPGDDRPRRAIELCELFAAGEPVSMHELGTAAEAAAEAAAKAAWAAEAAAWAARAAAMTAWAAGAAAWAARAAAKAAWAADWASGAADWAAGAAERSRILRECAMIVRRHYPSPPVEVKP